MDTFASLRALLQRVRNPEAILQAFDARVAAITEDAAWVITSPNQEEVPLPPFGTERRIRIRCDGRYGDDDYIQWPQPYSKHNPHHACILRPMTTGPLAIIWFSPDRSVDFNTHSVASGIGKLRDQHIVRLEDVIPPLEERVVKYQATRSKPLEVLPPLIQTMKHALSRLKYVTTSFSEMLITLCDVQRCWLEIRAALDYMEIFKPRMDGVDNDPPSTTALTIGAFVHVHRDAQDFHRAGLPFWFMYPQSKIVSLELNVLSIVDFVLPEKHLRLENMYGAKTIFTGTANDPEKTAAMMRAARGLLSYEDPFSSPTSRQALRSPSSIQSQPITGALTYSNAGSRSPPSSIASSSSSRLSRPSNASTLSPSIHPYSQQGRKKPQPININQDRFQPVQHALFPQPIALWEAALKAVNTDVQNLVDLSKRSHTDGRFMFPDPRMFVGPNHARQVKYFTTWTAVRDSCIYRVISDPTAVEPLSSQQWRDFLNMSTNFRRGDLEGIFGSTFQDLGLSFTSLGSLPSMSLADEGRLQKYLWELHQLNFHYELIALDRRICRAGVPRDEHQSRLLSCFSVDGTSPPNAFCIEYSNSARGLAAVNPQDRLLSLLALQDLFHDWQCELPITLVKTTPPPVYLDHNILDLEKALAKFYCQTFFNHFARAPTIPYRL
ncbi:hypothetical protein BDN72DRAFT_903908 [Pluteus cervinus]|uniref:Uncharacterized protein n=1 Tax=Pluteus cervinus TaxID=181527 RepID=A0ACD3A7I9_9AGAR|nr:hypothetical protein BDN72DRAFT_903908 [Pluteus cervinus]